jgi:hypothetical protein
MVELKNGVFSYFKLAKNGDATLQGSLNFDQYRVTLVLDRSNKEKQRF